MRMKLKIEADRGPKLSCHANAYMPDFDQVHGSFDKPPL